MPSMKGVGRINNINQMRQATKRGVGGLLWNPRKDEDNTIRILDEPEKWFGFEQHFLPDLGSFPCDADGCIGCDSAETDKDRKTSPRWAMNVLIVATGEVKVGVLPKTAVDQLTAYYIKSSKNVDDRTITDTDFDISREGAGFDTKYMVMPARHSAKLLMSKYKASMVDVEKVLAEKMAEVNGRGTSGDAALEEEGDDQFVAMDRAELKAFIRDADPDYKVFKSTTDDDLRAYARSLDVDEPEDEDEEDDEDDEPPVTRSRTVPARRTAAPPARRGAPAPGSKPTRKPIRRAARS